MVLRGGLDMFPSEISAYIGDIEWREIVDFHRSGDRVYSFDDKYILKISENVSRLREEYEKDAWISGMISAPKPVLFLFEGGKAYYLRERLDGENLCGDEFLSNPEFLADLLVNAINTLHNTKILDKKYILDEGYDTLIHGDFCLPNILVNDGKISGFIDLGDSGIGDPWRDYAWCIWSLRYNLKTDAYTGLLLEKLGIEFDQEKFDRYTK